MELGELLLVPVKEREMATVRERGGKTQEGEERSRGCRGTHLRRCSGRRCRPADEAGSRVMGSCGRSLGRGRGSNPSRSRSRREREARLRLAVEIEQRQRLVDWIGGDEEIPRKKREVGGGGSGIGGWDKPPKN